MSTVNNTGNIAMGNNNSFSGSNVGNINYENNAVNTADWEEIGRIFHELPSKVNKDSYEYILLKSAQYQITNRG